MKLAYITPTVYIEKFGSQGDFSLALSHLIDLKQENNYERAIKSIKKPIVLDNGLFENSKPEATGLLLQKATKMKASIVFAPDHLYDAKKTEFSLGVTIYEMHSQRIKNMKIAAVVQADNAEDWFEQYDHFQAIPEVGLIGLSILSIPKAFAEKTRTTDITTNRLYLLKELVKRNNNRKKCHLLGLGRSYEDVMYAAKNCPFVYSNDTSCCFQSGLFGKRLTDSLTVPDGKVKEKVNFELDSLTEQQEADIQYNIDQVKKHVTSQS